MSRSSGLLRRRRNVVLLSLVIVAVLVGVFATARRPSEPDLPTVEVKKGEFVDTLEIRGDIKPFKSIVLTSPMQSGELQIVKLAKNGAIVKPGDPRPIHERPDPSSRVAYLAEHGVVGRVEQCESGWCRIVIGSRHGHIRISDIWGVGSSEKID